MSVWSVLSRRSRLLCTSLRPLTVSSLITRHHSISNISSASSSSSSSSSSLRPSASQRRRRLLSDHLTPFVGDMNLCICRYISPREVSISQMTLKGSFYFINKDVIWSDNDKLFHRVQHISGHILQPLLPDHRSNSYNLRRRRHDFVLPPRLTTLTDSNFIIRQLFKDSYWCYFLLLQCILDCRSVSDYLNKRIMNEWMWLTTRYTAVRVIVRGLL